jgi:hypothetical protein
VGTDCLSPSKIIVNMFENEKNLLPKTKIWILTTISSSTKNLPPNSPPFNVSNQE